MQNFLMKYLGEKEGSRIFSLTSAKLDEMKAEAQASSKQQEKVLKNLLLPRIALYRVLQEQHYPQEKALKILEDQMIQCNALPMRKKYEMLDKMPCAFGLFKAGFTRIVASSDLWDADIEKSKKGEFSVTMRRCFWHDTFEKYGCPEMCRFACQCDDITYGGLSRIEFLRTQTLGTGGSCCDFCFRKK